MIKYILLLFLPVLLSLTVKAQEKVVYIQNENCKAGFLPDVGGRMVFFSIIGAENFLYSEEKYWNEPETDRIEPSINAPFKPYNGLITWLGPQSEWWNHQDSIDSKKGDVWPPDPWLIYGDYEIVEKTTSKLVLEGPGSPISGVKLTKSFELNGNKLYITTTAKNIRNTNVSWDIWSNARFGAFTNFQVPVTDGGVLRVVANENKMVDKVKYEVKEASFVFYPEMPSAGKIQRISKAFLYPEEGRITANTQSLQLTIEFDKVPFNDIHPEQALVEVYNCISVDGSTDILELEHHSAYTTLQAGESMSLKEVWTIRAVN